MMKKISFIVHPCVLIGFISFAILAIFRIFGKGYVTLIAIFSLSWIDCFVGDTSYKFQS